MVYKEGLHVMISGLRQRWPFRYRGLEAFKIKTSTLNWSGKEMDSHCNGTGTGVMHSSFLVPDNKLATVICASHGLQIIFIGSAKYNAFQ